jgi:hypothetical protein
MLVGNSDWGSAAESPPGPGVRLGGSPGYRTAATGKSVNKMTRIAGPAEHTRRTHCHWQCTESLANSRRRRRRRRRHHRECQPPRHAGHSPIGSLIERAAVTGVTSRRRSWRWSPSQSQSHSGWQPAAWAAPSGGQCHGASDSDRHGARSRHGARPVTVPGSGPAARQRHGLTGTGKLSFRVMMQ